MLSTRPRRVLFVSYQFPPVGGVGVHRVTKFTKFLPEYGWASSVLTVSNPSVPLTDNSLSQDIPPGTLIRRAKTYEPGYAMKQAVSGGNEGKRGNILKRLLKSSLRKIANTVLQPDPQVLWHPHAYREGLDLLKNVPHDVIVATGPPFSSLLLGARLAEATGLPLILDYRDEWDISNTYWENKGQGRLSNWIQQRQQARAIRAADLLLATTPSSAEALRETVRRHHLSVDVDFIYNGFDPDDFHSTSPRIDKPAEKFRLAFIGTLWNLNSIEPLVEATLQLSEKSPELAAQMELLLAGRRTDDQERLIDKLSNSPVTVTRLPFVSHDEAVQLMQTADALLMLNSNVPKANRIINAKTFEYMAARRPMFVVAPEGDVWDIVRGLPGTVLCHPGDIDRITEQLALAIEGHRCGVEHDPHDWDIDRFHRRTVTGELASCLDVLVRDREGAKERVREKVGSG